MSDLGISGIVMTTDVSDVANARLDEAAGTSRGQSPAVERTPFYFGPMARPLFGWYHAPPNKVHNKSLGLVICPSLGHEYINAHRSLRHLADRCAAAGVPTLRFDYDGTGNSAGADEDPGRLTAWLASIREAMAQLQRLSGCRKTGLVGLRIGATLAALTASEAAVSCLVLWAPCSRGQAYVREMKAMQLTGGSQDRPDAPASSGIEAGGFVFTEQTVDDLRGLNLAAIAPKAGRILIASRDDFAENPALSMAWSQAGSRVEKLNFSGYQEMMAEPHNTRVPHAAIGEIVSWVVSGEGQEVAEAHADTASVEVSQAVRFAPSAVCGEMWSNSRLHIRESIVRFGPSARRFGIMSEPTDAAERSLPTVVLSNAGAVHHVGASRLYVLLARSLSAAGFRCFRLDLPGLGDSVLDDPDRENDVYLSTTSAEIALALDSLEAGYGCRSFVLTGLCSGAHAAFHAGLDLAGNRIAECLLINPLTFYYKRGMSLDQQPARHFSNWQDYMSAARSPARWFKLLRGKADVERVFTTIAARVRVKVQAKLRRLRRRWHPGNPGTAAEDDLDADLLRLVAFGPAITFAFSRGEPGYDLLTTHAGSTVKKLVRQGHATIWFIDRADHTFAEKRPRCEAIDTMVQHLVRRYQPAA
jgi:alpha-beta hydrolase superfamily lysophospholipase